MPGSFARKPSFVSSFWKKDCVFEVMKDKREADIVIFYPSSHLSSFFALTICFFSTSILEFKKASPVFSSETYQRWHRMACSAALKWGQDPSLRSMVTVWVVSSGFGTHEPVMTLSTQDCCCCCCFGLEFSLFLSSRQSCYLHFHGVARVKFCTQPSSPPSLLSQGQFQPWMISLCLLFDSVGTPCPRPSRLPVGGRRSALDFLEISLENLLIHTMFQPDFVLVLLEVVVQLW